MTVNLGLHDPKLNDKEVHLFAAQFSQPFDGDRVEIVINDQTVDRAIANFVNGYITQYLEDGEPYVLRWIENGQEKERQLIAKHQILASATFNPFGVK